MTAIDTEFDLFVSYAHADDAQGWVTALVAQIEAVHARFTPTPLGVFFDRDAIRAMDDWKLRIVQRRQYRVVGNIHIADLGFV